jgi:hypothetical protein
LWLNAFAQVFTQSVVLPNIEAVMIGRSALIGGGSFWTIPEIAPAARA